jgi:hypothetical protein
MEKWRQLGHDVGFGIGIAHGFATLGAHHLSRKLNKNLVGKATGKSAGLAPLRILSM